MIGARPQEVAGSARAIAAAHRDLLADPAIQFSMTPTPPRPEPPQWLIDAMRWLGNALKPIGRLLHLVGEFFPEAPYARILLWAMIVLFAAALVWAVVERFRHGEWRLPRRRPRSGEPATDNPADDWQPDAAPIRRWLEEADALARAGRYAEAIHHLLFRSVEDMGKRRPQAVRPALTSRELAVATAVPPAARALFARIAALVERSLFGGRSVDAADWQTARTAYTDFTAPRTWTHG